MTETAQSVGELTRTIKSELESLFPFVRVKGELSNCKLHSSGHVYLTLKDSEAQLPAVMWKSVRTRFPMELRDGLEVIAEGRLEVYPPAGRYQLICTALFETGEGAQRLALERLIAKLAQAGYFDPERKKPIPRIPRRIGMITSSTGAVIRDMSDVFARRFPAAELLLYPVQVQGERAVESIVRALRYFNDPPIPEHRPDVLIVARGGGSAEDLQAFNDEAVAEAIYQSKIPVISAVGHETDLSVADMVADLRAGTPSIAAERAVPDRDELLRHIDGLMQRQSILMEGKISGAQLQLDSITSSYAFNRPAQMLGQVEERLALTEKEMKRAMAEKVRDREQQLRAATDRLEMLDIQRVLKRGFALVSQDDRYVTSAKALEEGAKIGITFHDGRREAKVTNQTFP
ncbi:exodeoxyribonuclease VII, large subunit [Chlorobaculum parvum NCIB 8327]|uniref:Exodeoxyribonuclease 7 large subunit n=1 Tax=Chlorobaculum parvum (strain DSM 263 / NCIMB 8327) TaxID=517417 RepID=B3QL09_CHLP8|nr:exodeoxyribonuclease VII large subunit [Chlorobaculum parvum]ACF10797.1 exodeoxyribonuclease VII, large subunit [Chlorobaculum parvum NCIB 8327]